MTSIPRRCWKAEFASAGDRARVFGDAGAGHSSDLNAQRLDLNRHRGRDQQSHAQMFMAILRLELPAGWRSEPAQLAVELSTARGEKQEFQFKVFPAGLQEGRATMRAVLESEGEKYSEGYTLVTREDLGSFYYYQPARQRVSIVDVQVPHDLKVGYIMGAGDDIPTVLQADRDERHSDSSGEVGQRRSEPVWDYRARHSRLRHAERCRGK